MWVRTAGRGDPGHTTLELHLQLFRTGRGRVPRPVAHGVVRKCGCDLPGGETPAIRRWNYIGSHLESVGDGFPVPLRMGVCGSVGACCRAGGPRPYCVGITSAVI